MKKYLLFGFLILSTFGFSQNYKTAVGIKGGFPGYGSLNGKHLFGSKSAIEASIGGGSNTIWVQGLYEIVNPLDDKFNWYYGAGPDFGFFSSKSIITGERNSNFILGVSALIGIEYTFEDFPLNLALDTGPSLSLVPSAGFNWGGAVAVRYAIK
ncbi:MAG: hypothetical protein EBQ94_12585 [Flavobacteriales bacterium]|nr:hypothetical protein [Crocinitomicaceae bacterium]NBX81187.1 hypothetical protein [Flavobacteriales bacterium]NCA20065.1 hypothetical protein [Crocinitomicaceae bacterium]